MAEVGLQDVVAGIEKLFNDMTHFVFWYDANGDFTDNLDELREKIREPIVVLNHREQVKTKLHLIDLEKAGKRALVYSPYSKPEISLDFLTDMELYNQEFTADAAAMLQKELGLPDSQREFVRDQAKFFNNKERVARFKQLNQPGKNPYQVAMAALAKTTDIQLTSILLAVIAAQTDNQNVLLDEFDKYDLQEEFWQFISAAYGYTGKHQLNQLLAAIFLNFAYFQLDTDLPKNFANYKLANLTNVSSFMLNWRQRADLQEKYAWAAEMVWQKLNGDRIFGQIDPTRLIKVDAFPQIDKRILQWLNKELVAGNTGEMLGQLSLNDIAQKRTTMHFGKQYQVADDMIGDACLILSEQFTPDTEPASVLEQLSQYTENGYKIDMAYRRYNKARNDLPVDLQPMFDKLSDQVERVYNNNRLVPIISNWTKVYEPRLVPPQYQQRDFYSNFVSNQKDRIVVIISDAFRFEAAKELQRRLDQQDLYTPSMQSAITGLPSVTYFGMPQLLPNHQLRYTTGQELLVDEKPATNLKLRRAILQQAEPASDAEGLDTFLSWSSEAQKQFIAGKKVIYFYHNTIDAVGDKPASEAKVFRAVSDAISELQRGIDRLRNISVAHIIVTADHGFIYRRKPLDSTDKINLPTDMVFEVKNLRYAIGQGELNEIGVGQAKLGDILDTDDTRSVFYPENGNVFTVPGAGQNYVHGGCSPQEMIIPVLDVRARRGRSQASYAELTLVTPVRRITTREVIVNFVQKDAISDLVKPATFKMFFEDDKGNHISGEIQVVADYKEKNIEERRITGRIPLMDKEFDRSQEYFLVVENVDSGEIDRIQYQMDLTVGGGFDFDI